MIWKSFENIIFYYEPDKIFIISPPLAPHRPNTTHPKNKKKNGKKPELSANLKRFPQHQLSSVTHTF